MTDVWILYTNNEWDNVNTVVAIYSNRESLLGWLESHCEPEGGYWIKGHFRYFAERWHVED